MYIVEKLLKTLEYNNTNCPEWQATQWIENFSADDEEGLTEFRRAKLALEEARGRYPKQTYRLVLVVID